MRPATKSSLKVLEDIIRRMPMQACCMLVVPEFSMRWREVSRAIRNHRLALTTDSVAKVLSGHAARSLPAEEVEDIVVRLRLKLIATQDRKWHVIKLQDPTSQLSVEYLMRTLLSRIVRAAGQTRSARASTPEVQAITFNNLIYLSLQMVSETRAGPILYVATPPGEPVALVSSLTNSLLKAVVEGLGYTSFEDAELFGRDIPSLLRLASDSYGRAEHLHAPPEYAPTLNVQGNTLDFTARGYDEQYVDEILGPNPPVLNDLQITSTAPFCDRTILERPISLKVHLKSDDIAKTLRGWVRRGALAPTSVFFQTFNNLKSNRIHCQLDEE